MSCSSIGQWRCGDARVGQRIQLHMYCLSVHKRECDANANVM